MGKRPKMSVLKRQRELRKAEKQAVKRETRKMRQPSASPQQVATKEDLAGYGFPVEAEEEQER